MQVKTEGIVFHSLKYSDNSAIVTIFTRRFGRVAYMIYGRGKRKSSWKPAFFQPLSIVELEVSHDMRKNIQQMKDVRVLVPYQSLTIDPLKRSIAMFIAEVLLKNHWSFWITVSKKRRIFIWYFYLNFRDTWALNPISMDRRHFFSIW